MEALLWVVFVLGYLSITLEHKFKVDKLIPALIMMALLWALIALAHIPVKEIEDGNLIPADMQKMLLHHLGKTAEILIFLLGAMTIVEITDHFNGFGAIKDLVKTRSKRTLLWIVCILSFMLSAVIDNLTATIVLITILSKLVPDKTDRKWFAGLIIIGANAGGAWSPIGDVTTTMLWIGNKVTTTSLIEYLFLPSLLCIVVPALIASFLPAFKGNVVIPEENGMGDKPANLPMLLLGLGSIMFVPIFKTLTDLPPYIGMMLSLAVVATVSEIISNRKFSLDAVEHRKSPLHSALSRIEMPSIFFFLGILLAVAALESVGLIFELGQNVKAVIPDDMFVILLGVGSAIIDNVPLVAASMGMFDLPTDDFIWHFVAFSAGTGGSMLIIGSAAGVVAMGMAKIDFFWYLKNISWLAIIGFAAGVATFMGVEALGL